MRRRAHLVSDAGNPTNWHPSAYGCAGASQRGNHVGLGHDPIGQGDSEAGLHIDLAGVVKAGGVSWAALRLGWLHDLLIGVVHELRRGEILDRQCNALANGPIVPKVEPLVEARGNVGLRPGHFGRIVIVVRLVGTAGHAQLDVTGRLAMVAL